MMPSHKRGTCPELQHNKLKAKKAQVQVCAPCVPVETKPLQDSDATNAMNDVMDNTVPDRQGLSPRFARDQTV